MRTFIRPSLMACTILCTFISSHLLGTNRRLGSGAAEPNTSCAQSWGVDGLMGCWVLCFVGGGRWGDGYIYIYIYRHRHIDTQTHPNTTHLLVAVDVDLGGVGIELGVRKRPALHPPDDLQVPVLLEWKGVDGGGFLFRGGIRFNYQVPIQTYVNIHRTQPPKKTKRTHRSLSTTVRSLTAS